MGTLDSGALLTGWIVEGGKVRLLGPTGFERQDLVWVCPQGWPRSRQPGSRADRRSGKQLAARVPAPCVSPPGDARAGASERCQDRLPLTRGQGAREW
jgi:hypothetical protein